MKKGVLPDLPMNVFNDVRIPFNKSSVDVRVVDFIRQVIESGKLGGDGVVCRSVELWFEERFNARHVFLTTSGSHALEMAMMMLDLRPGDEVITPSFTFVSTANAIVRAAARPVFCEINETTLTLDVKDLERKISKRTRAVVPVCYAGVSAEMDEICAIAGAHGLKVIEDAAQGVNAKYRGKYLGTIGDMGIYSFHETKNYVSGEGGAFITSDKQLGRRAEIIREKGTNRANFVRGEVDKYTWVDLGSSFVLSDILAAVLMFQLDDLDVIQDRRKKIHLSYLAGLRELEQSEKLRLPVIPEYCESNYHIFYVLLPSEKERNRLMRQLKESGIGTAFHYVPLHSSPYARERLGLRDLNLPVTDRISGTLLRLPLYPHLTDDDVQFVIEKMRGNLK
jgi:dTDP-4-amino-4,6-dideoxygalactose transaminase